MSKIWQVGELRTMFEPGSLQTVDRFVDALNDLEESLYDIACNVGYAHYRHWLRAGFTRSREEAFWSTVEGVWSDLMNRPYDREDAERAVAWVEDASVLDEQNHEKEFYAELSKANALMAEHTAGRGPNLKYGIGPGDYYQADDLDMADEEQEMAQTAIHALAHGETNTPVRVSRPDYCIP